MIREARTDDAEAIARIYNDYIENSVATFEELALSTSELASRISAVQGQGHRWLVAEEDARIAGYAYSSRWNTRSAYRFTAEVSVYLASDSVSKGLGTALYEELFGFLRQKGIRSVIGGITLPNPASQALHEKFGLRKVAHFERVGFKFGQWLDVGYWQGELDTKA